MRPLRVRSRDDAERLAAMWNASDEGWPGGWNRGVAETADNVLHSLARTERLAMLIAEELGGRRRIVGYGDLQAQADQQAVAYVPLLNVQPDAQGNGVGRAIVRTLIDRAIGDGYGEVTIHTWPGNRQSLPLYKKCGFQWVPDTDVFMQNYIPLILAHPACAPYFADVDWYAAQRREFELQPDGESWRGIPIFVYRFEITGGELVVRVDRKAERIVAVETPAFSISCSSLAKEHPVGTPHEMMVAVRSTDGASRRVTVFGEAHAGIELQARESAEVADSWETRLPFTIDPELEPRKKGEAAYALSLTVVVDGDPLPLATAVHPVQAVEIGTDGIRLLPHSSRELRLDLRNRTDRPVSGMLSLDPVAGFEVQGLPARFRIPAHGWSTVAANVLARVAATGATRAHVVLEDSEGGEAGGTAPRIRPHEVFLRSAEAGRCVVSDERRRRRIVVDTDQFTFVVQGDGGTVRVTAGEVGGTLLLPELGPPYTAWRTVAPTHRLEVREARAQRVVVRITADVVGKPGVRLQRDVEISTGPLVSVQDSIVNATDREFVTGVLSRWRFGGRRQELTLPLARGLIHHRLRGWTDYPSDDTDVPRRAADFAERWVAFTTGPVAFGAAWSHADEVHVGDGPPRVELARVAVAAESVTTLPPLWLVATAGDWRTVRYLARLAQGTVLPAKDLAAADGAGGLGSPVEIVAAQLEPSPIVVPTGRHRRAVAILNRRGRPVSGAIQVSTAARWLGITGGNANVAAARGGDTTAFSLTVQTPATAKPAAAAVEVAVTSERETRTYGDSVIIAGDRTQPKVHVADDAASRMSIDNSLLTAQVDAGFLGSLHSLRTNREWLHSSHPEAKPFSYMNPWHGGIHPFVGWTGDTRLIDSSARVNAVRETGSSGLRWAGCRVALRPRHEELTWLRLEVEYLTCGRSNLIAAVLRAVNRSSADRKITVGLAAWLRPAANWGGVHTLVSERVAGQAGAGPADVERVSRAAAGKFHRETAGNHWAAATDGRGAGVAMVTPRPDGIEMWDTGDSGSHPSASFDLELTPRGRERRMVWLVVLTTGQDPQSYAPLSRVTELP